MRAAAIALALTALAATTLAVTILAARGPGGSPRPGASATMTASAPTASASAAAPRTATLRVDAQPTKAHVFVDDVLLTHNPGEFKVQADGATHRIRVEAAGFVPQSQEVAVEGDRTFRITLSPLSGGHTATGTAAGTGTGAGHVKPPASGDPDLGF